MLPASAVPAVRFKTQNGTLGLVSNSISDAILLSSCSSRQSEGTAGGGSLQKNMRSMGFFLWRCTCTFLYMYVHCLKTFILTLLSFK